MTEPQVDASSKAWPSVLKRLALWTIFCVIAAGPSAYFAKSDFDWRAMACGVGVFAVLFTIVTGTAGARRLADNRLLKRAAYIGIFTRVALSSLLVFVGAVLDVITRAISVGIVGAFNSHVARQFAPDDYEVIYETIGFGPTLAITLVDGLLMTLALCLYTAVVYGLILAIRKRPPPDGFCLKCGYDLRASPERCPECGAPVSNNPLCERLREGA